MRSRPPWPQVALKLNSPSPSPTHSLPIPNSKHPKSIVHLTKTTSRSRLLIVQNKSYPSSLLVAALSGQSCSGNPILSVLSLQLCLALLSWYFCSASPFLPVFCLFCSACPVLFVLFCQSCFVCPVLPVLFCLSGSALEPGRLSSCEVPVDTDIDK
jgi:hypothetical protein